jgi:hypothetical protein
MRGPPIPQRIPPLTWRRPALLWTPVALAAAIGWPAALFYDDIAPQRLAIATLFVIFAVALTTLGVSWIIGQAPRTRRVVVLHVLIAGALTTLIAPFAITWLLTIVARDEGAGERFSWAMSLSTTPLVLMLGLPVVLLSGMLFAWIALKRGMVRNDAEDYRHRIQPFR